MKKNLMSVLIMALVLVNLILTAVLTISILPQTKQANELIAKVCAAIDLDLEGGATETGTSSVPMDKIETYTLNEGNNITVNLKKGEDGVEHYAVVSITLGINTEHEDYKTHGAPEKLADKDALMNGRANIVISGHTIDEMRNDLEAVQNEILKELHKMYNGSDFIVSVTIMATYS